MANQEAQVISSYPLPPTQYIKHFTNENVLKNTAPKPPSASLIETYSMFGNTFTNDDTIIRPLESQQIRRLYPQHFERKKELKKLNHSLFVNFLDLLDILIYSPESRRTEKIEDLTLLFVHIHHLLNEYRPHQARETLRIMMELQKRQRAETTKRFNYHLGKVREIVNNAFSNLVPFLGRNIFDGENDNLNLSLSEKNTNDNVDPNDILMCSVADKISL